MGRVVINNRIIKSFVIINTLIECLKMFYSFHLRSLLVHMYVNSSFKNSIYKFTDLHFLNKNLQIYTYISNVIN